MKVVKLSALHTGRLYTPPPPSQETSGVLISGTTRVDAEAIVRPEGLSQREVSLTPSGIKSATFRFVAQCLNQVRHRVPQYFVK
jgi:hypothetical protein